MICGEATAGTLPPPSFWMAWWYSQMLSLVQHELTQTFTLTSRPDFADEIQACLLTMDSSVGHWAVLDHACWGQGPVADFSSHLNLRPTSSLRGICGSGLLAEPGHCHQMTSALCAPGSPSSCKLWLLYPYIWDWLPFRPSLPPWLMPASIVPSSFPAEPTDNRSVVRS